MTEKQGVFKQEFQMEHTGGESWDIYHGDMLNLLRNMKSNTLDAVICDPPYASGGRTAAEKGRATSLKYSSIKGENVLPEFDGDAMDQRSWTNWMREWMGEARRVCKSGAPICVFIDWRQYPSLSDAFQQSGWIWRGVSGWHKINSRPQRGRPRQELEFVLWGSKGAMPMDRDVPCLPGLYEVANPQNRIHLTEKPLLLMKDIIRICEPNSLILDPFAGSGTTILAAVEQGHRAIGVEVTNEYYKKGTERVKEALAMPQNE